MYAGCGQTFVKSAYFNCFPLFSLPVDLVMQQITRMRTLTHWRMFYFSSR